MKINLRLSAAGFKPLINKENSKCENVKRMIPLVFGQRLFDDAERLKFYSVVGNCSFGGGFFSNWIIYAVKWPSNPSNTISKLQGLQ